MEDHSGPLPTRDALLDRVLRPRRPGRELAERLIDPDDLAGSWDRAVEAGLVLTASGVRRSVTAFGGRAGIGTSAGCMPLVGRR